MVYSIKINIFLIDKNPLNIVISYISIFKRYIYIYLF